MHGTASRDLWSRAQAPLLALCPNVFAFLGQAPSFRDLLMWGHQSRPSSVPLLQPPYWGAWGLTRGEFWKILPPLWLLSHVPFPITLYPPPLLLSGTEVIELPELLVQGSLNGKMTPKSMLIHAIQGEGEALPLVSASYTISVSDQRFDCELSLLTGCLNSLLQHGTIQLSLA